MRCGVAKFSEMNRRMDVNYHLSQDVSYSDCWKLAELKEIIVRDPNCYGFRYCKEGIPIVRIGDLKKPFIDLTNIVRISPRVHNQFHKTHLRKNDILMSVRGISLGKIGVYLAEYDESNISPNIIIIRLKNITLAPYVAMVLISEIGRRQIRKIIAGAAKPTITAPLINRIQIPKPTDECLKTVTTLFFRANKCRNQIENSRHRINEVFRSELKPIVRPKQLAYPIKKSKLLERWDPHYHNPKFQAIRKYVARITDQNSQLGTRYERIDTTKRYPKDQQIGYVEISNINCTSGFIEAYNIDYFNKLPSGGKIPLKKGDLLLSKVRPYRNAITIYQEENAPIVTASKNAFAVYRTSRVKHPYYDLAFLRSDIGLAQIVMHQSGTTYPTVSVDELSKVRVITLPKAKMASIDRECRKLLRAKEEEARLRYEIISYIEKCFTDN